MTRTPTPKKGDKKKKRRDADDLDELLDTSTPAKQPSVDKNGWPTNVPVLVAADMAWNFTTSDGRRDLFEWLEATFNPEYPLKDTKQFHTAYATLCVVITERFKKKVTILNLFLEFTYKNRLPCLAWQAACWNEMLARLGYEVPKRNTRDPGFRPARE